MGLWRGLNRVHVCKVMDIQLIAMNERDCPVQQRVISPQITGAPS